MASLNERSIEPSLVSGKITVAATSSPIFKLEINSLAWENAFSATIFWLIF